MTSPRINRTILLVAALALLAPVLDAQAQTPSNREVKVTGVGTRKCADWQKWKEEGNGELRAMAIEWTQGFIAGHNVYSRSGASNAVVADAKVLIPLFDNYCGRNPEMRLLNVVMEITQSLGGSKVFIQPKQPPQAPGGAPDRNAPRES